MTRAPVIETRFELNYSDIKVTQDTQDGFIF